jgi:hypothetical protein
MTIDRVMLTDENGITFPNLLKDLESIKSWLSKNAEFIKSKTLENDNNIILHLKNLREIRDLFLMRQPIASQSASSFFSKETLVKLLYAIQKGEFNETDVNLALIKLEDALLPALQKRLEMYKTLPIISDEDLHKIGQPMRKAAYYCTHLNLDFVLKMQDMIEAFHESDLKTVLLSDIEKLKTKLALPPLVVSEAEDELIRDDSTSSLGSFSFASNPDEDELEEPKEREYKALAASSDRPVSPVAILPRTVNAAAVSPLLPTRPFLNRTQKVGIIGGSALLGGIIFGLAVFLIPFTLAITLPVAIGVGALLFGSIGVARVKSLDKYQILETDSSRSQPSTLVIETTSKQLLSRPDFEKKPKAAVCVSPAHSPIRQNITPVSEIRPSTELVFRRK